MPIFPTKIFVLENIKVTRKRKVHEFYKENNKVHEFLFGQRKVSVKNKRFMNFLFMFFRCKINYSALLQRK
jgi:hypothetical protein